MHQIKNIKENNFTIIELKNNSISAKIVVNIGNTLYSLQHQKDEQLYFPFTLDAYKNNSKLAGNPFMHPWANRLENDCINIENKTHLFPTTHQHLIYRDTNNLPLHGLLLKSEKWEIIELFEAKNYCFYKAAFHFCDADFLAIFPFKHTVFLTHKLQKNELTIETTLLNEDIKPMPICFGFHPYFIQKKKDSEITIPAKNCININEKMIPSGTVNPKEEKWNFINNTVNLETIAFDDGFSNLTLNKNNEAVFKIDTTQIVFDKNYPFAQIYAPKNVEKPYVCIEPMTAHTNALNNNSCKFIAPNESFSASFTIVL